MKITQPQRLPVQLTLKLPVESPKAPERGMQPLASSSSALRAPARTANSWRPPVFVNSPSRDPESFGQFFRVHSPFVIACGVALGFLLGPFAGTLVTVGMFYGIAILVRHCSPHTDAVEPLEALKQTALKQVEPDVYFLWKMQSNANGPELWQKIHAWFEQRGLSHERRLELIIEFRLTCAQKWMTEFLRFTPTDAESRLLRKAFQLFRLLPGQLPLPIGVKVVPLSEKSSSEFPVFNDPRRLTRPFSLLAVRRIPTVEQFVGRISDSLFKENEIVGAPACPLPPFEHRASYQASDFIQILTTRPHFAVTQEEYLAALRIFHDLEALPNTDSLREAARLNLIAMQLKILDYAAQTRGCFNFDANFLDELRTQASRDGKNIHHVFLELAKNLAMSWIAYDTWFEIHRLPYEDRIQLLREFSVSQAGPWLQDLAGMREINERERRLIRLALQELEKPSDDSD